MAPRSPRLRALWFARRSGPEIAAAGLAVAAALAVTGPSLGQGLPLDDAWIHMVYGLSLRTHGALQYDDGRAATGCTSPAWAAVAALSHLLTGAAGPSMRAATALQVAGIALHAAQAALAARLARAWAPSRRWAAPLALSAGALVACAPTLAFAAASGMEVPLAGLVLLGALLAATRGRWALAGALAGLGVLVRPEVALAVLALPLAALALRRGRDAGVALGAGIVAPLALIARNLVVSGRPLPATFYVKVNPGAQPLARSLERGLVEVLGRMAPASHGALWACVGAAVALGAMAVARRRPAARPAMVGVAASLGLAYAGGIAALSYFEKPSAFYYQRYVAPPLVLLLVSGIAGAAWLARWAALHGTRWMAWAPCALALAGVGDEALAWGAARARFAADVASTSAQQVRIGRWIDANVRPGGVVWTIDAGAVRYWGRRPTVDLIRLNTPELFEGSQVDRAFWPAVIVVIPEIFQSAAASPEPMLELALVAESPGAATGATQGWRHEVHRCVPSSATAHDGRVVVFFHKQQVIASGHCAP